MRLVIAAFLLWWPQVAQCQDGKSTTPKKQSDGKEQIIQPTHVVIEQPLPTIRVEKPAKDEQDQAPEKPLPRFLRSEWVIVYITAIYSYISWKSLKAIKRQADTMDKALSDSNQSSNATLKALNHQIKALESHVEAVEKVSAAANDQWVVLRNWRIEVGKPIHGIPITVDVFNISTFPMTLTEGWLDVETLSGWPKQGAGAVTTPPEYKHYPLRPMTFLPPRHPIRMHIQIETQRLTDDKGNYLSFHNFMLHVGGMFSHNHRITKDRVDQPVFGKLRFGRSPATAGWYIYFEPLVDMNPTSSEARDRQRADSQPT